MRSLSPLAIGVRGDVVHCYPSFVKRGAQAVRGRWILVVTSEQGLVRIAVGIPLVEDRIGSSQSASGVALQTVTLSSLPCEVPWRQRVP